MDGLKQAEETFKKEVAQFILDCDGEHARALAPWAEERGYEIENIGADNFAVAKKHAGYTLRVAAQY